MVKHLLGVAYELLNRSQILHFISKPMGAQVTLVNVTVVFARYFPPERNIPAAGLWCWNSIE